MTNISISGFWYDQDAADRAVEFFPRYLRHIKGELAGRPLVLDPWQEDKIIRPLFGWRRSDGTRRYRRLYCEVPRKNGKSTLTAGIGLYLLLCDREPGAEIYSAASDREQAGIVFDMAAGMIRQSPKLAKQCVLYRRAIAVPRTGSSYKVLSADAATKDGLNAHGILFDELHAQPNRRLWDVLDTSTGARRQPLTVAITTAGYDRHSICWEQRDYALKVRDGLVDDPSFLPVIFGADDADDWTDPAVWAKANPGMGVSVRAEYLESQCRRALETPGFVNTFRRLHLCQWTETETRWLDTARWDDCGEPVDETALDGRECWGGLDLASTGDVTALVLIFPDEDGGCTLLCRFWVPGDAAERRERRDRVPYVTWSGQGFMRMTDGDVTDYGAIRSEINALAERFRIREIAYDRWNASQLVNELVDDGATMVPYAQTIAQLAQPTREFERLVNAGLLRHGGHPVLRWMASNVVVIADSNGNMKPARNKSTEKIDGIVAAIMGLGRATMQGGDGPSVYEDRQAVVLGD